METFTLLVKYDTIKRNESDIGDVVFGKNSVQIPLFHISNVRDNVPTPVVLF